MDEKTVSDDEKSNSKLFLDIDSGEYAHEMKADELWQQEAYEKVCELLKNGVKEAEKHKTEADDTKCDKKNNRVHMHDAICVSGARGTGKTAFLYNIESYWDKFRKEKTNSQNEPKLKFCPIIDPTLLIDNDNFVNVVVAHLHNQVQLEKSSKNID